MVTWKQGTTFRRLDGLNFETCRLTAGYYGLLKSNIEQSQLAAASADPFSLSRLK